MIRSDAATRLRTVLDPAAMRRLAADARAAGKTIGLVPTMGYLHEGHASLLRRARTECDMAVASIFVNPAQFGPGEDLARYPRDLGRDARLLERLEIDTLFHPAPEALYPDGYRTWVRVDGLSDVLCGATRREHFRGVATVVLKLLNIVAPDVAYFGQKDAQQAILIRRMVRDLDVPVRIEVLPTVREADGLALSSRNAYLSAREREAAPAIYRALLRARDAFQAGERSSRSLLEIARDDLAGEPLVVVEYLALVEPEGLSSIAGTVDGQALLVVAARIGETRLIDNIILGEEASTNRRPGQS